LNQAGDNHPMEQHVITAWGKPGEFVGHSELSGEDNDSKTVGCVADRASELKLYSAQAFRGKPGRVEPHMDSRLRRSGALCANHVPRIVWHQIVTGNRLLEVFYLQLGKLMCPV
jgi:hypothetical protein